MDSLRLALVCLRIGAVVFGGGMVMIPLMEHDVVDTHHWLDNQQFVDAVALGQLTPGPLLVTATLVGYKVGGFATATLATVCIFLPSFLMTLVASRQLQRLRKSAWVNRFLWGVRAAVVGMIVGAAFSIARNSCTSVDTAIFKAIFAAGALVVLLGTKVDAGLVVVACGLVSLALSDIIPVGT